MTKAEITALIESNLPDNATGQITAAKLREVHNSILDEIYEETDVSVKGIKPFETKALMDAFSPGVDDPEIALVMNDGTASNNGYYRWDGSIWVKRDDFYSTELDPDDTSEAVTGKAVGDYAYSILNYIADHGALTGSNSNFSEATGDWAISLGAPTFDINSTVTNKLYISFAGDSNNEFIAIQDILEIGKEYTVYITCQNLTGEALRLLGGKITATTGSAPGRIYFNPETHEKQFKFTITAETTYFGLGCTAGDNSGAGTYSIDEILIFSGNEIIYDLYEKIRLIDSDENSNSKVGLDALRDLGPDNTRNNAFGNGSQRSNTYGHRNNSLGVNSLAELLMGMYNTAMGDSSLSGIIFGARNAAFAYKAMQFAKYAFDNTALGYKALQNLVAKGGSISAWADSGGGFVTVTSAGHGLSNGETVKIMGTDVWGDHDFDGNYDGVYTVSSVTTDTFNIEVAYIDPSTLVTLGHWKVDGEAEYNIGVGTSALDQLIRGSYNAGIGPGSQVPDPNGNFQLSFFNKLYGKLDLGYFGFGETDPDSDIHNAGAYTQNPLSADPDDPKIGNSVQWVSDGTESGDAGDVMLKINVGGTVKTITLIDYSAQ